MKRFNKTTSISFLILSFLLVVTSCKKDLEISDVNNYNLGVAIPIGYAKLSIEDLIPEDSEYIGTESDGSIRFFYREDSIAQYEIGEFFNLPVQEAQSEEFKLGILELDDFGPVSSSASLGDLLLAADTTLANYIEQLDGTNAVIPAITSQSSQNFTFDGFDDFEYVHFADGELVLDILNNLPIEFSSIVIVLNTVAPDSSLIPIGNYTYNNLSPAQAQFSTVDLENITLYNAFKVTIDEYSTVTTPGPVAVELANGLEFTLTSNNLKVVGGKAKIPAQDLDDLGEETSFDFDAPAQLSEIKLSGAVINYNIQTQLQLPLTIVLSFPSATQYGSPVEFNIDINTNPTGSFDLSECIFDLTQNTSQPYNFMPLSIDIGFNSSDTWIEFDSASTIDFNYSIDNITFDHIQGWIGVIEIDLDGDTIPLDLQNLESIAGTINLADPQIHLLVDNNIGVPFGFNLDLKGRDINGNPISLNADPLEFPYPTVIGDSVTNEKVTLSNSNSDLSGFLGSIPNEIYFDGVAMTNPDSANTGVIYSNFATSNGKVNLGLEVELPLELSIDQLSFSDTIDFSVDVENTDNLESGALSILSNNGIPLEVDANLMFIDSVTGNILETIVIDFLDPALVDASGNVTQSVEKHSTVELTKDQITNLLKGNKLVFEANINTANSGAQTVAFYTDYELDFKLGLLLRGQIEFNND